MSERPVDVAVAGEQCIGSLQGAAQHRRRRECAIEGQAGRRGTLRRCCEAGGGGLAVGEGRKQQEEEQHQQEE